jgi:lipid A 3-O-deacylase
MKRRLSSQCPALLRRQRPRGSRSRLRPIAIEIRSRAPRLAAAALAWQLASAASIAAAQEPPPGSNPWRLAVTGEWGHDTTIYGVGARLPLDWQREPFVRHGLEPLLGFDLLRWVGNGPEGGHLWDVNATPYVRWRPASAPWHAMFLQAGIGVHLLSATKLQGAGSFGSVLQFGEQLAGGFNFGTGSRYEVLFFVQHVSNGGLADPNNGKTSYGATLGIPLD